MLSWSRLAEHAALIAINLSPLQTFRVNDPRRDEREVCPPSSEDLLPKWASTLCAPDLPYSCIQHMHTHAPQHTEVQTTLKLGPGSQMFQCRGICPLFLHWFVAVFSFISSLHIYTLPARTCRGLHGCCVDRSWGSG